MSYNRLTHAIAYLETKMNEMISEGRVYYPDDEEYDNVFSPKEEVIYWG